MKKNLRIVSAAAAALLAVAPVAATVVPAASTVSAAVKNKNVVAGDVVTVDANLTGKLAANGAKAYVPKGVKATVVKADKTNATVRYTANGKSYTVIVPTADLLKNSTKEATSTKPVESTQTSVNPTTGNLVSVTKGAKIISTDPIVGTIGGDEVHIPMNTKMVVESSNSESTVVTVPAGTKLSVETTPGKFKLVTLDGPASVKLATKDILSVSKLDNPSDSASTSINGGSSIFNAESNTSVNVTAVAKNGSIPSAVNGSISVTLGGQTYEALLHTDGNNNNTEIFTAKKAKKVAANNLTAGHYIAVIRHATVFVGNDKAGTAQTFTLSRGEFGSNGSTTKRVVVDANGVADLGEIQVPFYAYDATKEQGVHFYEVATGNVVTSGNVTMHAVNGKLSVQALYAALNAKYGASQFRGGLDNDPNVLKPVNDLKNQLEKAGMKVSPEGYFTPNASFSINMNAKSNLNGATATLPVTVTVDNVTPAASQETTKTVKIMHIATIYDKNGKATHEPALRAYNTVSVVSEPVSLKDAGKFYKLAGKDQYIKVGNVDGTSRSLKHNSYVYKSTGKRRGKTVLKKGSSVTTYGKSFMIAGHQMYRIGENKYVKKANF